MDNVGEGVRIEAEIDGVAQSFAAERLLLATGRSPNTERLDLEATGVNLAKDGFIEVEDFLRTSAADVFAAGDVVGEPMFVYTAAYEGALAAANACAVNATDTTKRDYNPLPWVVFTDPQVAGVGLDERQAKAAGIDAESITLPMDKVPRALIARQTDGFLQLIRDRETDQIIGGRALAHEGSELMMEISLAIGHRIFRDETASEADAKAKLLKRWPGILYIRKKLRGLLGSEWEDTVFDLVEKDLLPDAEKFHQAASEEDPWEALRAFREGLSGEHRESREQRFSFPQSYLKSVESFLSDRDAE